MPDSKISNLPTASDLDGSESWVAAQSGTTVQLSTSTLYGSISKTYAELTAMIIAETLISGAFYYISDRGITLKALSTSLLSTSGIREMRIVKNTYYVIAGINKGVWNSGLTVSTSDRVVWGGKVFTNITGSIGSSVDDDDLDATNWLQVSTTDDDFYYTKAFFVTYNFSDDYVSMQQDDRYNVFYQTSSGNIERSDWGNENIYNNTCWGIYNNSNDSFINFNRNTGAIYNNSNTDIINNNICKGIIYDNSNTGAITSNYNGGGITSNSNTGNINANTNKGVINNNSNVGSVEFNNNIGSVSSNSNNGYISFNSNNGGVYSVGSANTNITYNINNGDISTTTTGAISDTIVNK